MGEKGQQRVSCNPCTEECDGSHVGVPAKDREGSVQRNCHKEEQ